MIFPYRAGSASVKALSQHMSMKQIRRENSKFRGHDKKLVINWGAKALSDEVNKCVVLNDETAVKLAGNKLSFFQHVFEELNVPEFTTKKDEAFAWLDEGKTIVVRETLNGHSGEGIVLIEEENEFEAYDHSRAKMYVKYIPKKQEYRVHVVAGEAIDIRRKALRSDFSSNEANWKIRNHSNGFIFAKDGFEAPQDVIDQAITACKLCNLDFGAVDVIYNDYQQKAYVIEVNTAPGLEGSTVDNYAKAFATLFERHEKAKGYGLTNDQMYKLYLSGKVTLDEVLMHAGKKKKKPQAINWGEPQMAADWGQ